MVKKIIIAISVILIISLGSGGILYAYDKERNQTRQQSQLQEECLYNNYRWERQNRCSFAHQDGKECLNHNYRHSCGSKHTSGRK